MERFQQCQFDPALTKRKRSVESVAPNNTLVDEFHDLFICKAIWLSNLVEIDSEFDDPMGGILTEIQANDVGISVL